MSIKTNQNQKNISCTNIQDFQFLKKLGEGAYSSVYKVRRKADNQIYALKKVKMKNLSQKQKQNSLNQVRILASINHQNVVSYKQAFFQSQSLYIVMQYADGGDLFGQISVKKKKIQFYKQQQIWVIFYQLVAGLNALHSLKIIHRDLKSANAFMNKNRQVKLGDMNVSKVGQLCMTQTGTPYYASPQIWKDLPYDFKSDIWSLGCVLYETITFSPPFKGVDMQDLYQNVTKSDFIPIPATYSQNLKYLITSMLEKNPVKRPSTLYLLENIEKIVPQQFHLNNILKQLIKKYSKKNKKNNTDSVRINQLMKTIQFPNKKKKKPYCDSQLTSFLPSPSYSRSISHRTPEQKQNFLQNNQKLRLKPQSLFIPAVNITLDNNKKKRENIHQKPGKNKKRDQNIRKSMVQKVGKQNRLVLPLIDNKRIHLR